MACPFLYQDSPTISATAQGPLSQVIPLAALSLAMASLSIAAAPAKAFQTTVDFSASPTVSNQTSRTFNGGFGVQANFSNPKSLLSQSKTIDNNSNGICIAKSSITTSNSCGRTSIAPNTNFIYTQGTIDLQFNQTLYLQGFRVGQNSMNQITTTNALNNPGALNFKLNGVQFATFAYSSLPAGNTLYQFPGTVYYQPGDIVTIQNTGFSVINRSFYLKSFEVSNVPAPLPILATATAFGWSRRLRRRVSNSPTSGQS